MKQSWTKGLDETRTKDVRGDFLSSLVTRKRLIELLEEKISSAEITSQDKAWYDVANWAYKQADLIGYKRALRDVINLVTD